MQPNFENRFRELAEAYRRREVSDESLRTLVWETFKAYAPTADDLNGLIVEPVE